jgi:hypothetical protein
MTRNEVKIGGMYTAKVTNRLVQVRIDKESRYGGWDATNMTTGKPIRIKSPQRLRSEVVIGGRNAANKCKDDKKAKDAVGTQPAQTSLPTAENVADAKPTANAPEKPAKVAKPKSSKATKAPKEKRMSGLDAAAKVLEETGGAMNVKEITELAITKGYWKPAGRTPSATLASALMREIVQKGGESRFRKSERGKFVHA